MCPMLWCREGFQDEESTLGHIITCPWITDTWYWCPFCGRPESYVDREAPAVKRSEHYPSDNESILRDAAFFFQKLSFSSRVFRPNFEKEAGRSVDTPPYALRPSGSRIDAVVPGKDAGTYHIETISGLSRCQNHTLQHQLYDRMTQRNSSLSDSLLHRGHTAESELVYLTPIAPTLGPRPTQRVEYLGDPSSTETGAPQDTHRHGIDSLNPKGSRLNTPKSDTSKPLPPLPQIDISGNYGGRTLGPPSRASHSNNSVKARPEPMYWRAEDRRQLWTAIIKSALPVSDREGFIGIRNDLWKVADSNERILGNTAVGATRTEFAPCNHILTPEQLSVYELRRLVFVINQEWRKKLHSKPDLFDLCSNIPDQKLFDLGLATLQRFFRGQIVNGFIDVFALSHVAMASAYLLHRDEELYPWGDLFEDIYLWRHTILGGRDLVLFIKTMHALGKSNSVAENPVTYGLSERSSTDQLFETLRCGDLIENCSSFLDSKVVMQR